MIHLLRTRATTQQLEEMLEILEDYIKLAVDVQRGIAAGGGELHADCESVLLVDGSQQEDIWGQAGFRRFKRFDLKRCSTFAPDKTILQ